MRAILIEASPASGLLRFEIQFLLDLRPFRLQGAAQVGDEESVAQTAQGGVPSRCLGLLDGCAHSQALSKPVQIGGMGASMLE